MKRNAYYIYDKGAEHPNRAVIVAWEEGARGLYQIAKQLHDKGCGVDVILGFADADKVEMECEYAALSNHLYVFTLNGSHGARADAESAVFEMLFEDILPDAMFICCPEDMRNRIDERMKRDILKG